VSRHLATASIHISQNAGVRVQFRSRVCREAMNKKEIGDHVQITRPCEFLVRKFCIVLLNTQCEEAPMKIGATSISFRPKVFSDPASVVD
jgi:hypothetical protein